MRHWVVLCAVGIAAYFGAGEATAGKSKKPVLSAVPGGTGWYCSEVWNTYDTSDRASTCQRSLQACEFAQQRWADGSSAAEFSDCRYQAKAAVFTYFDIMQDATLASVNISKKLCKSQRQYMLKQHAEDIKNVSTCAVVGDLETEQERWDREYEAERAKEKAAKLKGFKAEAKAALKKPAMLAPQGTGWWCLSADVDGTIRGRCFRSETECRDLEATAGEICEFQAEAAVVSYLVESIPATVTIQTANMEQCKFEKTKLESRDDASLVSKCSLVGTTGAPHDSDAVPAGDGWFCLGYETADGIEVAYASCFRDSDVCMENASAIDKICMPLGSAWVLTHEGSHDGSIVPGFTSDATFATCDSNRVQFFAPKSSRCDLVD